MTPKSKYRMTPIKKTVQKNTLLNYFGPKAVEKKDFVKTEIEKIHRKHNKIAQTSKEITIIDLCDSYESCDTLEITCNTSNINSSDLKKIASVVSPIYSPIQTLKMPAESTVHSDISPLQFPRRSSSFKKDTYPKMHAKVNAKKCPSHKVVKDTPFAVDAFSYGEIPGVSVYFLTHFHSDHYMGLKKSFSKPIYCTKITAMLCQQKLYVKPDILNILEVGKTIDICGFKVSTLEANHCPGSIMLVINLPNNQNILHCGDFRATPAMESYPIFASKEIHTVYLDNTYCNPRYTFPTQAESIEQAIKFIKIKKTKMVDHFSKLLIVCGTYTIGKENFFMGIADEFNLSVWADPDKQKILKIALEQDIGCKAAQSCQLHVLPMGKLNYQFLDNYLKSMDNHFSEVIAFKPSGWEISRGSLMQRGNVTILGVPYSEHSSFLELQRFMKFLQPKVIIPTVVGTNGCGNLQKYFSSWVGEPQETQKRISNYFQRKD